MRGGGGRQKRARRGSGNWQAGLGPQSGRQCGDNVGLGMGGPPPKGKGRYWSNASFSSPGEGGQGLEQVEGVLHPRKGVPLRPR